MPIDTQSFNILERLVFDHLDEPLTKIQPRILVKRHALHPSSFSSLFEHVNDRPGFPLSKLLQADAPSDWTSEFQLDPLANNAERNVLELNFPTYCDRQRDSHRKIEFGFSNSVPNEDGHLLYCTGDRGFLWAWGILCRYRGSFKEPSGIEIMNVLRS